MKDKIQGFLESMAAQFQAGRQIINGLNVVKYNEAKNTLDRDIDSFCVEANRWFGADFNEKEFKEIVYSN